MTPVDSDPEQTALVLNCGSATVKFAVMVLRRDGSLSRRVDGLVDGIGATLELTVDGREVEHVTPERSEHDEAVSLIHTELQRPGGVLEHTKPDVIGHRVVHGGDRLTSAVVVDEEVERQINTFSALAPLHNPAALATLRSARGKYPGIPQVAVFDTSFHATLPRPARTYAVPALLAEQYPIRRFGFHGISCASVTRSAAAHLDKPVGVLSLVICHLGGGASVTAVKDGCSVDTSMGMTPLEGLVMGTRSGDIDPSMIPYLTRMTSMTDEEVLDMLTRRSGLLGLCGDADMRMVRRRSSEGDEKANDALAVYTHRIRHYVGAYVAQLPDLDAVVFTGGVGEHDEAVRREVIQPLRHLGFRLDEDLNRAVRPGASCAVDDGSGPGVLVIGTDEELEIAGQALALLS